VPSYRATRIGLPLLAWALALGDAGAAIFVYQLLCWVLAAFCVWVVARWLEDEGHSPWWAAPLIFCSGIVTSIYSSLPDAAACTLLVLALWLHSRERRGAFLIVAISSLVKETNLIAAAATGLSDLRSRRYRRAALQLGVPVAAVVAWSIWVRTRPGFQAFDVNANFGVPFAWIPEKLSQSMDALEIMGLAGLLLAVIALAALLPSLREWTATTFTYAGMVIMALFLTRMVYIPIWWNYTRVLLPLPVLAVVLAERERVAYRRWLLRAVPLAWGGIGAALVYRWAAGMALVLLAAWILWRRAGWKPVAPGVQA
jgi:hypothetical protein